jgi:hypothetical protein
MVGAISSSPDFGLTILDFDFAQSNDFGLTPPSSVGLENFGFRIDVSEAYAAQRVFFHQ